MEWEAIARNEAEKLVFRALLSSRQGFGKDQELSPALVVSIEVGSCLGGRSGNET
jgi:hypothetical protein